MPRQIRTTELPNPASAGLDTKSTREILRIINREDRKVAPAVGRAIPQIERAVDLITKALAQGGRLIYMGAGTSGRLGLLDAAECMPTFGTDQVIGVMAGSPQAMLRPTEASEDNPRLAVRDLRRARLRRRDVLVGISASGRTPYVLGGMQYARSLGARTVGLTCNPEAPLNHLADVAVILVVGPEVIAGSSRMKAGTAQKLVLNMLSTASMVRLGRVLSNLMVNVQLTNHKLRQRGLGILRRATGASQAKVTEALKQSGGRLPVALLMLAKKTSKDQALRLLASGKNIASVLRSAGLEF
jgi:N-acetylmuramic acid 6-phosphate etherase